MPDARALLLPEVFSQLGEGSEIRSSLALFRASRGEAQGYLLIKESKLEGHLMLIKLELLLPKTEESVNASGLL